jgi:spermidine synthase
MPLWFDETYEDVARYGLRVNKTLYHARSKFQTIDIFETELFGKALALDGIFQTSVGEEHYYHEMLIHPTFTTAPVIANVMVIGGGDGGSVREILSYPEVERVTMIEIDHMVVDACKQLLPEIGRAWDDPRLDLRFDDGIRFLEKYDGAPFDVIVVDGSDPIGPAEGLFRSSFYANCKKRLTENGVLTIQSESPHIMAREFFRIMDELGKVFPRVRPYFGPVPIYASGGWSYTHSSAGGDPLAIDEERAARVEKSCRYYNREIHRAAFILPNNIKQELERRRR